MRIGRWLVVVGCVLGCDGGDREEDEAQAESVRACSWNFRADVREGPSAPLAVEGTVLMYEYEDGQVAVQLEQADGSIILAGGTVVDGDPQLLHLNFTLPDGGHINGVGPLPASGGDCSGELLGDLVGPAEGDRGDWLANSPIYEQQCFTVPTKICNYTPRTRSQCRIDYCSFDYYLLPGETFNECLDRCSSGLPAYSYVTCSDPNYSGPAVSTFFGTGPAEYTSCF